MSAYPCTIWRRSWNDLAILIFAAPAAIAVAAGVKEPYGLGILLSVAIFNAPIALVVFLRSNHRVEGYEWGLQGYDWRGRMVFKAEWSQIVTYEEDLGNPDHGREWITSDDSEFTLSGIERKWQIVEIIKTRNPNLTIRIH